MIQDRLDDVCGEVAAVKRQSKAAAESSSRAVAESKRTLSESLALALVRLESLTAKSRAALARRVRGLESDLIYLLEAYSRGKVSSATAAGRAQLQFRCLACDQPTESMPGPESAVNAAITAMQARVHEHAHALDAADAPAAGVNPGTAAAAGRAHAVALAGAQKLAADAHTSLAAAALLHYAGAEGAAAARTMPSARTAGDAAEALERKGGDGSSADGGAGSDREFSPIATAGGGDDDGSGSVLGRLGDPLSAVLPDWPASERGVSPDTATQPRAAGDNAGVGTAMGRPATSGATAAATGPAAVSRRSMMVVDRGAEMTLYGNDGHVYRGRGNTRVLFAPPSRAADPRFQISYVDRAAQAGYNATGAAPTASPAPSYSGSGFSLPATALGRGSAGLSVQPHATGPLLSSRAAAALVLSGHARHSHGSATAADVPDVDAATGALYATEAGAQFLGSPGAAVLAAGHPNGASAGAAGVLAGAPAAARGQGLAAGPTGAPNVVVSQQQQQPGSARAIRPSTTPLKHRLTAPAQLPQAQLPAPAQAAAALVAALPAPGPAAVAIAPVGEVECPGGGGGGAGGGGGGASDDFDGH